jgi:TolB-like protein
MADDHLFLLPIVIDDTNQAVARVPEKFLAVQWLKVPGGRPTPALESLCRGVASPNIKGSPPAEPRRRQPNAKPAAQPVQKPEFPREEPGQKMRFWAEVFLWACRSAWALFKRLPRWVRIVVYVWLAIALISRCGSSTHEDGAGISPAKVDKLKAISEKYPGTLNKNDIIKLGTEIAKNVADDSDKDDTDGTPLLAIPFTAPAGDAAAQKLAESAFATAYGKVSLSRHGQVSVSTEPLPSRDLGAALERGRANHSTYVLCGSVDSVGKAQVLTVKIAKVADGSVIWSKTYPAAGADPTAMASEVEANIPPSAPP